VEWFQWWNTFLASVKPWVQTPVFEKKKKKERKKEKTLLVLHQENLA
jgi:hypothetical protein